jgi:hypothetical protein
MILTIEQKRERVEWIREQALWIQRVPNSERSRDERLWLEWAERRVGFLMKEVAA